jgi:hypothetical protein
MQSHSNLAYNGWVRRLFIFAAFLLIVSLVPVCAQRGGGGRGGSGGHAVAAGHLSGGHSFGGVHSGFSGVRFSGAGFGGGRFRGRGFHHCFGFGCRFGFGFGYPGYGNWGGGYYDPLWDSSSSYNNDEEREQEVQFANQMNALNIQEQNLREREDWLREREEQDAYARRQPVREEEHAAPSPATVLVFRDQHKQEIANYAISGGTLWVLSDHLATKKIPINELDLAATTKANDERGVEFQVPK